MRKLTFKATVRKIGNSSGVIIPAEYIGTEIKEGDTYWVSVELKEGEQNE